MPVWSPEQVEHWPVDRLIPYAGNARTHSDEQVAQIAGSIVEFGFAVPVLVDERGVLIAGHGRLLAARRLGLESIPVIRTEHLIDAQARALRIADNQIAANAGWDEQTLATELARLQEDGLDLDLLGFSAEEVSRLLDGLGEASATAVNEDQAPELPEQPVSKPGDLWLMGAHRLVCGDATDRDDVARLLDGAQPHLMVTDPPYGVDYDPSWRNEAGVSTTERTGRVANDDRADWRDAWALFPGDVAYVWHAGIHAPTVAESLAASGFAIRSQLIWVKPRFALSRAHYHWRHEPCWYCVRDASSARWQGARDQNTVWEIGYAGEHEEATVHGTQKPVECMRRPMLNNSIRGDLVYDPFAGSGSALIAAETTGRCCLAMELDPRYCDVIVERWQRLTLGSAFSAADELSYTEIAESMGK